MFTTAHNLYKDHILNNGKYFIFRIQEKNCSEQFYNSKRDFFFPTSQKVWIARYFKQNKLENLKLKKI